MPQSRVTSLEKACDDNDSHLTALKANSESGFEEKRVTVLQGFNKSSDGSIFPGLGNKYNLKYSCIIWIMIPKILGVRACWCTCWCNASRRLSSCVSSTLLPMLTEASSTWHRLCREEEGKKCEAEHAICQLTPTRYGQFTDGQRLMALCLERQIIQITKTT